MKGTFQSHFLGLNPKSLFCANTEFDPIFILIVFRYFLSYIMMTFMICLRAVILLSGSVQHLFDKKEYVIKLD